MRPPFCNYTIDEAVRVIEATGQIVADPLAIAEPCNCLDGHFKDFAERLARFNPELKLGFDCIAGCYMVYRNLPRIETIDLGGGESMKVVTRQPLRIKPCQWVVLRKVNGGRKFFHFPREPGDWLLRDLHEYAPAQFELDGSWVGPTADRMAAEADSKNRKQMKDIAGQVWDDVVSVADRGNPLKIRTGVHVKRKVS